MLTITPFNTLEAAGTAVLTLTVGALHGHHGRGCRAGTADHHHRPTPITPIETGITQCPHPVFSNAIA
ncbi:MAG: hypothetical protein M1492_03055 [Gammaproteobacteria bacterium]|nr:hypothetical protein [Gammaproteobacteria bacterium]